MRLITLRSHLDVACASAGVLAVARLHFMAVFGADLNLEGGFAHQAEHPNWHPDCVGIYLPLVSPLTSCSSPLCSAEGSPLQQRSSQELVTETLSFIKIPLPAPTMQSPSESTRSM